MTKYSVWDKVIIKPKVKGICYDAWYMREMEKYAWHTATIVNISKWCCFEIDIDLREWLWSDDMVIPFKKIKKEKVIIIPPTNINLTLKQIAAYKRILKL